MNVTLGDNDLVWQHFYIKQPITSVCPTCGATDEQNLIIQLFSNLSPEQVEKLTTAQSLINENLESLVEELYTPKNGEQRTTLLSMIDSLNMIIESISYLLLINKGE